MNKINKEFFYLFLENAVSEIEDQIVGLWKDIYGCEPQYKYESDKHKLSKKLELCSDIVQEIEVDNLKDLGIIGDKISEDVKKKNAKIVRYNK